jgi:hypothetical protein
MSEHGKAQRTFDHAAEARDLVIALLFLAASAAGVPYWFGAFGPNTEFPHPLALILFILSAAFGAALLWIQIDIRLRSVRLYTGGIEVRFAGRRTVVAWDDIRAVAGGIPVRHRGVPAHVGGPMRLELADGRRVTVPSFVRNFDVLADRVHEEVLARLLPAAERELRRGGRLRFGPLAVERAGVHFDGRVLPWERFGGFSFPWRGSGLSTRAPDRICLHADDPVRPWASAPIQAVTNAHLLVALARAFGRAAGTDPEVLPLASPNLALPPDPPAARAPPAAAGAAPPSRHTASWRSLAGMADNSVVLMGLGGFFFLLLCPASAFGWAQSGADRVVLAALTLAAAGVFVGGLVTGLSRPRSVEVSPAGLAWTRRGRRRARRWDEVRQVFCSDVQFVNGPGDASRRGARLTELRVVFRDGAAVRFNHSLSDYDGLVAGVQRAATAALLPAARRRLRAGGVDFGGIRLTAKGIAAAGKVLPWEKVERVWVGNGHLGWRSERGQARQLPLKDVPNYGVLLSLIREQIGERCEETGIP